MSAQDTHPLHVLDVCGTLVHDDTTLGLLRHHFSRMRGRRLRRYKLHALTWTASPLRIAIALLEKFTSRHLLKHMAIRMLAGDRAVDLDESGREYARELLENRCITPIWARLDGIVQSERIILASASLEPVVAALADAMGARYVASTLVVRDGLLTGRYLEDVTGKKRQAITDKFGAGLLAEPFIAYSDNISDLEILAQAVNAIVVLRRGSHRARWQGLAAEFVRRDE